jgi:hypothetical protein
MNRTWCMDAFHIHHLSITSTWAKFHYLPDIFIFYKTIINASFLNVFSTLKNLNLNKKIWKKKSNNLLSDLPKFQPLQWPENRGLTFFY